MTDVTEPGWRPEYTGDTSLGNVGTGVEFGADLYDLYRAGRNKLPAVAATYADLTIDVHETAGAMRANFNVPTGGVNLAHRRIMSLRDDVHEVFRLSCLRMEAVGKALVEIAVRYAATDEAAAAELARILDDVEDPANQSREARLWPRYPPVVPDPPAIGDPQPVAPVDDGHLVPPERP